VVGGHETAGARKRCKEDLQCTAGRYSELRWYFALRCALSQRKREVGMGIWIELGVFMLVFVFAIHQFYDLKQEKRKREAARKDAAEPPQSA
jgi:hypothetical protein